jgi:hypothetical protein
LQDAPADRKETRMTRNLKALGLALVAVFAMGAVVASAAQAQGMFTTTGPTTLRAVNEVPPELNVLTALKGGIACPNVVYTGHKVAETPHKFLANGAKETTITPHYGHCTGPAGTGATVDMNGCDYVFDLLGEAAADKYNIRATVICPAGKHITITFWKTPKEHTEVGKVPFCHATVTESAAGYLGLTATDLTNGHLTVKGSVGGIVVDKPAMGVLCPAEEDKNGELHISINVEGRNEAGKTTAISLSK